MIPAFSARELERIAPLCTTADLWQPLLAQAAAAFDILDTEARLSMWIANLAHESGSFRNTEENLHYSAQRIQEVWPRKFKTAGEAKALERNPQALANAVYARKNGNGDERSGDGYRFRGRGLVQLTGRDNYAAASKALGADLVADPALAALPDTAAAVAAWYWQAHGCNELADAGQWGEAVRAVNGSLTGLQERTAFLQRARAVLNSRA